MSLTIILPVCVFIALTVIFMFRAEILIRVGDSHLLTNNFEKAGKAYERALRLDKKNAVPCFSYGTWLINAGKPDEAIEILNKGLLLTPPKIIENNIHIALISAWVLKNNKEEAMKRYEVVKTVLDADVADQLKKLINKGHLY